MDVSAAKDMSAELEAIENLEREEENIIEELSQAVLEQDRPEQEMSEWRYAEPEHTEGVNGHTVNPENGVADYSERPFTPSMPMSLDLPPMAPEYSAHDYASDVPLPMKSKSPSEPASVLPSFKVEDGIFKRESLTPQHVDNVPQATFAPMKEEIKPASSTPAPVPNRLETMRARIEADPFDAEAHLALIASAESSGDHEAIKSAYEGLLEPFAGASSLQISYLTHFLNSPQDFPYAESVFARFLRPSPSVELWRFYLTYIRRVNPSEASRETVKQAYEFAVNHIGQDKDSGDIWKDYLTFLKETPTHSTWEEQQKMDATRRVYQRCVAIPLENVEQLWRDFDAFENGLNKITAKKFLATHSPAYMTARTSLRNIRSMLDPLTRTPPPMGLPVRPIWIDSDRQMVAGWKTYLKWEEGNPLDIEDANALSTRIQFAFKKALSWMRFFPEIWYMYFTYLMSLGKVDEGAALLKQGMHANRSSFLLHFAFAELEESRQNVASAHACFNSLLSSLTSQIDKLKKSIEAEADAARGPVTDALNGMDDEVNDDLRRERDEREARGKKVWDRRGKELEDLKAATGVAWIMLMRFARRAEGLKPARAVFGRARRSDHVVWQVFEAAALLEYHCTKDPDTSIRIFEVGLKIFGDNTEYVLRYLGFLISINDDSNARALFERVIPTFPTDKARPIWERWARYEYNFGDFAAAQTLEKRIAEAFPSDPPIKRFAQRHQYLSLDTIAARDLGFGIKALAPQAPKPAPALAPVPAPVPTQLAPMKRSPSPSRAPKRKELSRERGAPPKRFRPSPPPPVPRDIRDRGRERERDRGWDRGRDREREGMIGIASPRRDQGTPPRGREDDHAPGAVPPLVSLLMSRLPSAAEFDGPVFKIDNIWTLCRDCTLPPISGPPAVRPLSPPPRGRPPPDYGPYRGPNSGPRRY